jgi:predicted nucleic acid-binding protein
MVVVDTSAWIEVLADRPLKPALMQFFPKPSELVVPTIVQLELSKWLKRE